jgi:hypothetical protein
MIFSNFLVTGIEKTVMPFSTWILGDQDYERNVFFVLKGR